jgi:EAL domain-containing protein (putative c-di-GMP-specific phosphodiesterase class I)
MSTQFFPREQQDLEQRERARLQSLADYGLGDVESSLETGELVAGAARSARDATGFGFAAINIIGETDQLTIAGTDGVDLVARTRANSMCGRILYATGTGDVFYTGDASRDPDLRDNPWVTGLAGNVRFYAGAALIGREGLPLGMLCVYSGTALSDAEAEQAGQRLIPIRDTVVGILDARRDAGLRLAQQTIEDDRLSAEIAELMATQGGAAIDAVIDAGAVRTLFQPIMHLGSATVAGYEALTRGPAGTDLESPIALLAAARAVGRLGELDWLCRTSAMRAAAASGLPNGLSWFINVEPAGLEIDCPNHLRPVLDLARAQLRVVLEVVERDVEDHVTRLVHATDQARRDAWGVALDDVGAESGSLALLPFLQPDVVKLDMSLLREAPSAAAADITAAVRTYAERTGAVILAEGIETPAHEELAKVFGATYGQGYLYGRPAALPQSVAAPEHPIPLRQRLAPIQGATPFEVLHASVETQRGRRSNLVHIYRHLQRYCAHADEGAVILALFDRQDTYLDNQACFDDLAELNALTVCLVPGIEELLRSSPRYHVGPLPCSSRLATEAAMIVVTPHYAGALLVRQTEHFAEDGTPLVDYIYTHDRPAIVLAARAYLDHMKPGTNRYSGTTSQDNVNTEQTRRARLSSYLLDRLHPALPGR